MAHFSLTHELAHRCYERLWLVWLTVLASVTDAALLLRFPGNCPRMP